MGKGRFTLPGESGMEDVIGSLIEKWGADAIRDSDGTSLSPEMIEMGLQVYSTICLVRMDNAWLKMHPHCRQQIYLLTKPVTAVADILKIDIMAGFFRDQFEPNTDADIKRYWQVNDRTADQSVCEADWVYDKGIVKITNPNKFHQYTVTFLAYQIWEPVSMYNHLTNDWTEEHKIPLDIRYPEARQHMLYLLEEWLEDHPKTDVVRFTTFFYNFDLIYNQYGKEKQVNWFGYLSCVSEKALQDFQASYGYPLYPEDFADAGRFHTPFKNPDRKYLDWMDFNQKLIAAFAKECVQKVHRHNKKAIMFLGDHWTGTEPYGKYFPEIGLDAVVGAAGDGVTTRMIADIPVGETEARFYPYFFPDIFHDGGDPVGESIPIWQKCRRAILQKPMARMGYGGYLSLAYKFPDFVDHVQEITGQFRSIHEQGAGAAAAKANFKVAILNSWGNIRSWMTHQVAHSLWNQRCYSYLGAMEALAGLPFEIEFINFDDIKTNGIPEEVGVIINAGDGGTSWSGGDNWNDPEAVALIRKWVYEGGGFIGIGEPSASGYGGRYFQLEDVLGVQKEMGFTASTNKPPINRTKDHFLTVDINSDIDYGEGMTMIYPLDSETRILDIHNQSCGLTANEYGRGRAVYLAGAPYNFQNSRLIQRSIFWSAGKEKEMFHYYADNTNTECFGFPGVRKYCIINNSSKEQQTNIYLNGQKAATHKLAPMGMKWIEEQ